MPESETPQVKTIDVKTSGRLSACGRRCAGSGLLPALSATHLTANPPIMMVSIDKRSSALATVIAARHFAVNYLPRGSGALKGAERFEAGLWTTFTTGAPIFIDAVGALDCVLDETIERHGVAIAIGRLVNFTSKADREPMISFRGSYRGRDRRASCPKDDRPTLFSGRVISPRASRSF